MPPAQTHTFTLPSLHDSTVLFCTLCLNPATLVLHQLQGIALLAHPYAPLGGSSSDPVLALATTTFLEQGYIVCLFDFRGAGRSEGRTSWTANGEREDYVTLVGFCITYLTSLSSESDGDRVAELDIVLGGYSYGSLIVQSLPPFKSILGQFCEADAESGEAGIIAQAQALAVEHLDTYSFVRVFTIDVNQSQRALKSRVFRPSSLLISPLLQPISTLLSLQFTNVFMKDNECNLTSNKTLAVFGGHDTFTSSTRLIRWADRLKKAEESQFKHEHIVDAGHFWNEAGAGVKLQQCIASWLDSP